MNHELQPYLPGFSPREAAPFKGSEHLTVFKRGGDYDIDLTSEGAKVITTRRMFSKDMPTMDFMPINAVVDSDEGRKEVLQIRTTRDYDVLHDTNCHDGIFLMRDKEGPIVIVATWLIGQLMAGEREFLVTRYDGHTNKIWIRMQEPVNTEVAA